MHNKLRNFKMRITKVLNSFTLMILMSLMILGANSVSAQGNGTGYIDIDDSFIFLNNGQLHYYPGQSFVSKATTGDVTYIVNDGVVSTYGGDIEYFYGQGEVGTSTKADMYTIISTVPGGEYSVSFDLFQWGGRVGGHKVDVIAIDGAGVTGKVLGYSGPTLEGFTGNFTFTAESNTTTIRLLGILGYNNYNSDIGISALRIKGGLRQTLTILGGLGNAGDIDPYTEASRDEGLTWQPAYLTGWHPWGFAEGTNSWVNFDPSPFVGLNSTTDYRIRFYVPEEFSDPKMIFVIKADNRAWLSINGAFISQFDGESSGAAGDQIIEQNIHSGLNEITIRLQDFGGWVGLNYRIDLSMYSNEELTLEPSTFSNTAPVAAAGEDQTVDCAPTAGSEVTLTGSGSDTDNDPLTYSWSNGANTAAQTLTLAPGTHTFTLTVNDGKGGVGTDDVTITINADVTAPVADAETLADVVGECSAVVETAPTATDACGGAIVGTTTDPLEYTAQGDYVITWTFTDANGNSSQQTQNVAVHDVTAPDITAPVDADLEIGVAILAVYEGPSASAVDNCDANPVVTSVPSLPATFTAPGTYTITYTATDINGNSSSVDQTVNVYSTTMLDKYSTLASLSALITGDKKVDKKIEEAIRHIEKSVNPELWDGEYNLDSKKGEKVFEEEKEAVQQLREVVKSKYANQSTKDGVTDVVLTLVNVDRTLAQTLIDEVQEACLDSKCMKDLDKANEYMAEAEKEASKGNYDKAIEKFKGAWEKVNKYEHKNDKGHKDDKDDHGDKDKDDDDGDDDHDGKDDDNNKEKKHEIAIENDTQAVEVAPTEFALTQNYPNPFNPSTTIQFATPEAGFYTLKVYNMLGQEVADLFTGQLGSGIYNFNFDASNLSSGVYIYSLRGNNVNITKKMNLMK